MADSTLYLCEMRYPRSTVSALNAPPGESIWDQVLPDQAPEAHVKPALVFGQDFTEPLVLNGLVDVGYRADEDDTLIPVIAALDGKTGALQWRLANGVLLAAA